MKQETIEVLKNYIEQANILRSYNFEEHVKEKGLGFSGKRTEDNAWIIEFGLPDLKDRNAFILTFRLFIQRNESICFDNLPKLFQDPDISPNLITEVTKGCTAYTNYLNSYSHYSVEIFDGHPTRSEMLVTVLYGGNIAHTNNPKLAQKYKLWTHNDICANILLQEFTSILVQVLVIIKYIADACEIEIKAKGI